MTGAFAADDGGVPPLQRDGRRVRRNHDPRTASVDETHEIRVIEGQPCFHRMEPATCAGMMAVTRHESRYENGRVERDLHGPPWPSRSSRCSRSLEGGDTSRWGVDDAESRARTPHAGRPRSVLDNRSRPRQSCAERWSSARAACILISSAPRWARSATSKPPPRQRRVLSTSCRQPATTSAARG